MASVLLWRSMQEKTVQIYWELLGEKEVFHISTALCQNMAVALWWNSAVRSSHSCCHLLHRKQEESSCSYEVWFDFKDIYVLQSQRMTAGHYFTQTLRATWPVLVREGACCACASWIWTMGITSIKWHEIWGLEPWLLGPSHYIYSTNKPQLRQNIIITAKITALSPDHQPAPSHPMVSWVMCQNLCPLHVSPLFK